MNIGQESEAFIAEPLPEPTEVPVKEEAPEREEVLVPVGRAEEAVLTR